MSKVVHSFVCKLTWKPAGAEVDHLRRMLCAAHGLPDGVPLDEAAPADLVRAHYAIGRAEARAGMVVELLDDGTLRIAEDQSREGVEILARERAPAYEFAGLVIGDEVFAWVSNVRYGDGVGRP